MLLAIPGLFYGFRSDNRGHRAMAIWAGIGLLLVFIPFSLQRRFFLGLYIPLAGLAILEIDKITKSNFQWGKYLFGSVFLMSIFTNIIVLLIGQFGVITHDNHLYLTTNEKTGLAWLNKNGEKGDVVLTGPETGLFVPAYTRLRVLYGHPFETLDAETMEQIVISIFKNELSDFEISKLIEDYSIDYIFVGPRENKLGFPNFLLGKTPAFQNDDVMIYAIFE